MTDVKIRVKGGKGKKRVGGKLYIEGRVRELSDIELSSNPAVRKKQLKSAKSYRDEVDMMLHHLEAQMDKEMWLMSRDERALEREKRKREAQERSREREMERLRELKELLKKPLEPEERESIEGLIKIVTPYDDEGDGIDDDDTEEGGMR